jgi:CheY-like chemotaxis protein
VDAAIDDGWSAAVRIGYAGGFDSAVVLTDISYAPDPAARLIIGHLLINPTRAGAGAISVLRDALLGLMKAVGLSARAFPSAEEFFASDERHQASCVVTDVLMPAMSGLYVQERLLAGDNRAFVIFITAYTDERRKSSRNMQPCATNNSGN